MKIIVSLSLPKADYPIEKIKTMTAIHEGRKVKVMYYDKKYCMWYVQLSNGGMKYTNLLKF